MSKLDSLDLLPNLSRRDLLRTLGALGACGLVERDDLAQALSGEQHISRLASQPPSRVGTWVAQRIEGQIPEDLNGSLYRMSKGQLDNHGVSLRHWFDGDSFLIKFSIAEGVANVSAQFVETPERQRETTAGAMLFREYGTVPPGVTAPAPYKNQPNINVILWDGRLLGLSEAFHPTAIDPETLAWQGAWDFHGTLPPNVTFTAHPKIDVDGRGYTFGTNNGLDWALMVYRMEVNGTLTQIAKVQLGGYFMIHDMLVGSEHLVFVVPPVQYDFMGLAAGAAAADVLHYMENNPTRLIVIRKDGTGNPVIFNQPPGMVYHHGNLIENGNSLRFHSLMSQDGSVLALFDSWSEAQWPSFQRNHLVEFTLDLGTNQASQAVLSDEGNEFPRFDVRRLGSQYRYLYASHEDRKDPFAFPEIARFDLLTGSQRLVHSGPDRTLGEPVFVPRPGRSDETDGWLLFLGYDASMNETFLEIRDAETMDLEARVWIGEHLPLGFHGSFYNAG